MASTTLSIRMDDTAKERLARLAQATGRTPSFLAAEAIETFLDLQEWQVGGIREAMAALDRGQDVAVADVRRWVESWNSDDETPAP